ncbi:MAG: type ISP restriction/modification enzyme [Nostoc sp.]
MSKLLVSQYHTEVERIIQYGGSRKETSIRVAFQNLVNEYCKPREFRLIPELDYKTASGKLVYPDGTVKDALRLDWGYWESKDEYDNLDQEIEKKLIKGYPDSNILFEDSKTAVLIQGGHETRRVLMKDADALDGIITSFINYVRPEVKDFREAIETFKEDLPSVLNALRDLIDSQIETNAAFQTARAKFWGICKESINPEITLLDVREMMIQHILTEDIFISIFNESQFHRENNIARELKTIIDTFFTGSTKKNTLGTIERYYGVIRRTAANIYNHHEKQKFLKVLYENFYKAYNPKAADRLGIVYTPNEIVRFMIESVDYLVHKNFGKLLADKDVEILDPATGTGTFITELIDYLPKNSLEYKYKHEIHCNEVAILPYYIANLNIEYTYKQKMGEYQEFENICFVDTLEHTSFEGKQMNLLSLSVENTERIKRQNESKISVIIGNPPYNANQANENDNNKNRSYPEIDKLIKESYVKYSHAQKTKRYDPYSRFFRWATNRLNENGILAFITNSSFIHSGEADGFRKVVSDEFSEIYIIDLGGDVRSNPKISGTKHNVFGIQAGVAISFMVKKELNDNNRCKIFYTRRGEFEPADEKLNFIATNKFNTIYFEHITPDNNNNWMNLNYGDFYSLIPLADKETKATNLDHEEKAVFKVFSFGVSTNRDEWVYDFNPNYLISKIELFSNIYNKQAKDVTKNSWSSQQANKFLDYSIKWSESLKINANNRKTTSFQQENIVSANYRPYFKTYYYADFILSDRLTSIHTQLFGKKFNQKNLTICLTIHQQVPFVVQATDCLFDAGLGSRGTQGLSLYRYDKEGNRIDNITDWGLAQFQNHYNDFTITKLDIFHYTYALLHNPAYRTKYELKLKEEFPRLPFYEDFQQWVNWGKKLMNLHINYETVEPYPLKRIDLPLAKDNNRIPKAKLKADTANGTIILDDVTTLEGVPKIAWEYRLGNRCALEWILDQYKEKKPKDPTIA